MDDAYRDWLLSCWRIYMEKMDLYDKLIEMTPGTDLYRKPQRQAIKTLGFIEGQLVVSGYGERDTDGNFRLKEME